MGQGRRQARKAGFRQGSRRPGGDVEAEPHPGSRLGAERDGERRSTVREGRTLSFWRLGPARAREECGAEPEPGSPTPAPTLADTRSGRGKQSRSEESRQAAEFSGESNGAGPGNRVRQILYLNYSIINSDLLLLHL